MAVKFPPHTFTDLPARWVFKAGGAVSHIPGSQSIACERCRATAGAVITGPAGYQALAAFLHSHAGPTCNPSAPPTKKTRRSR